MEFLTGLQGTPAPTLILLGGFVFLFFGIATIKKPIVIEISTSGRKIALGLGALLVGAGLYLLISQQVEPLPPPATETPSPMPTSSPTNTLLPPTAASTPLPPIGLSVPTLQDAPEGQEFFFDTVVGGKGRDLTGYTLEIILEGADGRDAQLFFKNCNFDSVYSIPQPISNGIPIQFNPASDPRRIDGFSSFTCISGVGIKIFNNAQGIKIVSAQLIIK